MSLDDQDWLIFSINCTPAKKIKNACGKIFTTKYLLIALVIVNFTDEVYLLPFSQL